MAIRLNNAGIVEAIKSKSGSAKFYRPSFEGIIQAIQDWGGGGGGTSVLPGGGNLPNTNQEEGNLVVIPDGEGNYFMYVYAGGSWEKLHITTTEVMEAGSAPFSLITLDGTVLTNQQDVNLYLAEAIQNISEKGYDDGPITNALEQEIKAREDGDEALTTALEQEIKAREDEDEALKNEFDQDQKRQDDQIKDIVNDINKSTDPDDNSTSYRFVTHSEFESGQKEQDEEWEDDQERQDKAIAAVVTSSDQPPAEPVESSLWFDTKPDELTLYINRESTWVPAAPPVSLDGINATIEAALVVQSDLVNAVNEGIEEQNKIKLDLEELQVTKGSVARYKITATSIGAAGRNGELYVMSPIAADVQAMSFAPFDLNGQPIKPCNPGDIIELVEAVSTASIGEVTRYRIVSGDSNALTVEYLSGTNDFEVDEDQEVYIYPQNEVGASKDYVDDSLVTKLGNAGANDLASGTDWKVRQQNASGGNKTLLQIKAGELGVYNLKEPTQSHHAATKAYVDAKPSGSSGFGISASRPPGLKFMLSIVNLPNGYFQWWTNANTNNQHLELATTDKDGIAWGTNTCREDVRYSDKIPFTIWEVSNNAWKMKVTGTISRIDFHPDHALCYVSSKTALNGGNFVNGAGPYYITISGLF